MAGKKKSRKLKSKPSEQVPKSTISTIESDKENKDPNKDDKRHVPCLTNSFNYTSLNGLDLNGFDTWMTELKDEDAQDISETQIKFINGQLLDAENQINYVSDILKKKIHINLVNSVKDNIKHCSCLNKFAKSADFYSKGPLKNDYLLNKLISLDLFKSAKTDFELLLVYQLYSMNASLLSLQEQFILNKTGNEITANLIKNEANLIFTYKKELESLAKLKNFPCKLDPIVEKIKEHENAFMNLEEQVDLFIESTNKKIELMDSDFKNYKNFFSKEMYTINLHKDKLFGLLRKANGRMQGLYKLLQPKNMPTTDPPIDPPIDPPDMSDHASDEFEELEDSNDVENQINEEEEEEDEWENSEDDDEI